MTELTVVIQVDNPVLNTRGEPVRDMLDPPVGMRPEDSPDMTLGSLIANALYLGITGANRKEAMKYFVMAGKVEEALKPVNEGKWTVAREELDQLEEAWGKINVPVFTLPIYGGAVQHIIDDAKVELLAKEKDAKDPPKSI